MSLRKEDTELIKAAKAGDRDTCARLLQGNASDRAYVNGRGGLNSTALIEAATLGHIGIVELLLDHGARLHAKEDAEGNCPILAASRGGHVNVVELLISKGANPNDKDKDGNSPIIVASIRGHLDIVDIVNKWPFSMAIIVLQELYCHLDASSLIDLRQYIGVEYK